MGLKAEQRPKLLLEVMFYFEQVSQSITTKLAKSMSVIYLN